MQRAIKKNELKFTAFASETITKRAVWDVKRYLIHPQL